jgi:hypothetical protein
MSDVYRKFRGQMAAGGDTQDLAEESSNKNSALSVVLLAVFFVWLGMNNPWMLVFVIGLIISIFLHEFGHYWTARKTGMKVTQFYMGFGPRLWSRKRGELEYGDPQILLFLRSPSIKLTPRHASNANNHGFQ